MSDSAENTRRIYALLACILALWCFHLTIDTMDPDASQYAAISSQMSDSGSYLHVYDGNSDYLDKPPLLFWLSSASISIFGKSDIAYKLPSVLLLIFSLWITYRLAFLWYGRSIALLALLILASTQAYHLMTLDVRTDGLLTVFVVASIYALSSYLKNGKTRDLMLGGICIGLSMLAKGPIGLIIPTVAIGGHLVLRGDWAKIFHWKWLLLIIPIAILLLPMCYGLYTQFDLHPEKNAYNMKSPSGLRFYFWTQSFGRITGESYWDNGAPSSFFLLSFLWDFQPWVFIFIPAFVWKILSLFSRAERKDEAQEWITLCGFVIPFAALSTSNYKLPHYIFPLFPFASIIAASCLVHFTEKWQKGLLAAQMVILHLFVGLAVLITCWAFPPPPVWLVLIATMLYIALWWFFIKSKTTTHKILLCTVSGMLIFQLALSTHLYPNMLHYQASSAAGKFIRSQQKENVYWVDGYGHALDFYSHRTIPHASPAALDTLAAGTWLYVSDKSLSSLPPYQIIRTFDEFRVTQINFEFLQPSTRSSKLQKRYIVALTGHEAE